MAYGPIRIQLRRGTGVSAPDVLSGTPAVARKHRGTIDWTQSYLLHLERLDVLAVPVHDLGCEEATAFGLTSASCALRQVFVLPV